VKKRSQERSGSQMKKRSQERREAR
jgi:hypothetical protein